MPQLTSRETATTEFPNRRIMWNVTSAFPGRIRLQSSNSSSVNAALHECATRIAAHPSVMSVSVIQDARSLVVHFDPSAHRLANVVKEVASAAQSPAGITRSAAQLTAPIARRSPVELASRTGKRPALRLVDSESSATFGGVVGRSAAFAGGRIQHIRARDISLHRQQVSPLIAPSIAVALLAIDVVPVALSLAVLAVASIPIVRRTVIAIRNRQFTPDSMDTANIVLVVFEGSYLQAGLISWLVQVSDLIRQETMKTTRKRLHAVSKATGQEEEALLTSETVESIEEAPLGDSLHQHTWTKAKNKASLPLTVLALTAFAITGDPGYLIGILRPRADFNAALCFGVPGPLLAAITRSAAHGPRLTSGVAVERLAQIDAIVFATVGGIKGEHHLGRHVRPLMKRGIHRFILPTEEEAHIVRRTAERAGIVGVVAEPMPHDRHSVVQMLVRHGHHVALIDDGLHSPEDIAHADIQVVIDTGQEIPDSAHVVVAHANLHGLVHAIDSSREAVHAIRKNTALAASAAGLNLLLSLVPPVAATAVNTATTAIVAANSLRSNKGNGPPERPPHLPRRVVKKHKATEPGD